MDEKNFLIYCIKNINKVNKVNRLLAPVKFKRCLKQLFDEIPETIIVGDPKFLNGFKALFNEIMNDPEKTKKIQESRASTILLKGKEFPNVSCLHYLISPPPNDIILEPSSKNDPIINQIIVSSILFIYIIKYIFINNIEKNKWYK